MLELRRDVVAKADEKENFRSFEVRLFDRKINSGVFELGPSHLHRPASLKRLACCEAFPFCSTFHLCLFKHIALAFLVRVSAKNRSSIWSFFTQRQKLPTLSKSLLSAPLHYQTPQKNPSFSLFSSISSLAFHNRNDIFFIFGWLSKRQLQLSHWFRGDLSNREV